MGSKIPRILIVTIEGLGTNLVGCYGGAIAPTKHWDHFSSRAIVFDQFWSDTVTPFDILESMWCGKHFACRQPGLANEFPSAALSLLSRGILVTDAMDVIERLPDDLFADVLFVDPNRVEAAAEDAKHETENPTDDETQITRLFETAIGRWASDLDSSPLLWIHSQGLNGKWDAPYEYRCVMCDEGDPDPPKGTEPANLHVTDETDPDEVFGLTCAVGGQAIAFDNAWGMIEETLEELGIADDCLQILAGVGGFPCGEHGWVGTGAEAIYAENLHLPLIVRPAHRMNLGTRVPFIVQPASLLKTMINWMNPGASAIGSEVSGVDLVVETDPLPAEHWPTMNQLAYSVFRDQVHVVVPAWSCRWSSDQNSPMEHIELFAMPDDRWQQNEVSQRALHVVDELALQRSTWLAWLLSDGQAPLERLPSELTHPIR